jgi:hypothetical protein
MFVGECVTGSIGSAHEGEAEERAKEAYLHLQSPLTPNSGRMLFSPAGTAEAEAISPSRNTPNLHNEELTFFSPASRVADERTLTSRLNERDGSATIHAPGGSRSYRIGVDFRTRDRADCPRVPVVFDGG